MVHGPLVAHVLQGDLDLPKTQDRLPLNTNTNTERNANQVLPLISLLRNYIASIQADTILLSFRASQVLHVVLVLHPLKPVNPPVK